MSDNLATGVPGLTAVKKTTQAHGASPEGYKKIPVKLVAPREVRNRIRRSYSGGTNKATPGER